MTEAKKTARGTTIPQDESPDFADQASMETDSSFVDALMRLEDGTFGMCQECGGEISMRRLKIRPIATLCITCKQKQETEENTGRL